MGPHSEERGNDVTANGDAVTANASMGPHSEERGNRRDLDYDPQWIYEKKSISFYPVAVIPLPYMSAKVRAKVRKFANGTIWPKT